jgi:type IV pilus assembly protein PilQ
VFTTGNPPRVAIDLPDTRSEVEDRRITVGSGATSAISTVEAAGRTRVVIDLFRPAAFETRHEGNRLVVSIGGGDASIAGAVPVDTNDPAKRVAGGLVLDNVDFRRTPEGAGRVVLQFSGEGAAADMRTEGDRIVVDLANVQVPEALAQRLDVTDFATPVQTIESRRNGSGGRVVIAGAGDFESLAYQTGNEYVVEVAPVAAEEAAAIGLVDVEEGYTGKPVTFNFQDIPVRTVLQLIAEESGLNIVAADTVQGNVTLRLINVPWDQALDIILRAKSLDKRRDGNVVWVAPQSEIAAYEQAQADARIALEQREELVTEYIPINYGNAEDIAALLTDEAKQGQGGGGGAAGGAGQQARGFLSPRGSVSFDRRTNTLLLNDTPSKILEIKQLIAVLDRPVDQVLIEARIVIATQSFAKELGARFGISGGYEDDNGNILTTTGNLEGTDTMGNVALNNRFQGRGTGLPVGAPGPIGSGILVPALANRLNVNLPVVNPTGSIGFALLGADYLLDLELSALENEGRGEVVSSPRVITANQREASIRQGDEVGYVTISPTAGGNAIPIPNVQFKEVLLELKVTPTITQDGRVYLVMNVIKDEVEGFVDTSIGSVPQIATREINTAVLVDNGQTVVIGGVYEFSNRESLNKVPFLGDVPFLGNLFRNKQNSTDKAELLIFVTPKVLQVSGRGS